MLGQVRMTMGTVLTIAAYGVYAAFWLRFFAHLLLWWRAVRRLPPGPAAASGARLASFPLLLRDLALFWRLLKVNPALWIGEWTFHVSFVLVVLRHLRYFLNPVPSWVWDLQLPGLIAGYLLPVALLAILLIRLFSKREKYTPPANLVLLVLLLVISAIGVAMHGFLTPDLVDVKLFAYGIMTLRPAALPEGALFLAHFVLALAIVLLAPTHIVAAPLVMYEARRRDLGLRRVMHDEEDVVGPRSGRR
jgi:nitrate reductase gamma subunit